MTSAPPFRNSSTQRTVFFKKLKPCCLEVVKTLRRGGTSERDVASAASALVGATDQLYGILTDQINHDATVLDASMADYVFFPLLPIFQNTAKYPARLVENATKCLRVLIQDGWKTSISKDNAQQFLILLTSVVTGGTLGLKNKAGATPRPELPEETVTEGYRALAALMRTAGAAPGPESPLVAGNAIPALAHTVTVMLEGVTDSVIPAVQLEALGAVEALYTAIKDPEVLASFLPGTVSSLVRFFSSPGSGKNPRRVVVRALEVLYAVLVNTLGDLQTRHLHLHQKKGPNAENTDTESSTTEPHEAQAATLPQKQKLDASWLKATASQIKVALATVLKLRNHESEDVRDAVQQFCIGLLDECHTSLAECTTILVESAIVTTKDEDPDEGAESEAHAFQSLGSMIKGFQNLRFGPQTTLADLAILYPELGDVIKSTAYNWATSLPRAMQSSDEDAKQRAIRNLQKSIAVLETLHIDSLTLENSLTAALRDSVVTLVLSSTSSKAVVNEAEADDALSGGGDVALLKSHVEVAKTRSYQPVLMTQGSQKGTREALLHLLANVGSSSQKARLAADMLDFVREADGLDQVATFWLSFELVKASFAKSAEIDKLLDFTSLDDGGGSEAVFDDLFAFSVSTLASHSDAAYGQDWRMGAIALEVTSYAAARMQEAFRPELIDVLYPIATYLGSSESRLRSHAITTLNGLAASTGYTNVSELIVDNVDYMLNSVSLRLNTFDISPASTKVLTMMIRLAGPKLVPYLDDVVAAIFAALENYHGYPLFVESLFSVLGEVVQQSVKSDTLLLENTLSTGGLVHNRKRKAESATTADLADLLDRRAKRRKELTAESDELGAHTSYPKQPWKSEADELLKKHEKEAAKDESEGEEDGSGAGGGSGGGGDNEVSKPEEPKTPTYALLARITTLTQHYLTSPTPTLRKSLLDLLSTVAPALAPDENAFLPLVNAIWPVVISRLYDGEPYVVIAACHALSALCGSAGDFVSTRIKAEWHANLGKWSRKAKRDAAAKSASSRNNNYSSKKANSGRALMDQLPSLARIHGQPSQSSNDLSASPSSEVLLPFRTLSGDQGGGIESSSATAAAATTGLGRFAQVVQIWEAVAGLLTAIVAFVKVDDEIYDEILDLLLAPAIGPNGKIMERLLLPPAEEQKAREALEAVNADAVWLADYRAGRSIDLWMTTCPPDLGENKEGARNVAKFVSVGTTGV